MLAGLLAKLRAGADFETALRYGTALAAAEAEAPFAGRPNLDRIHDFESSVHVVRAPANDNDARP